MKPLPLILLAALTASSAAYAQTPAPAPAPPRARGPALDVSIDLAKLAVAACQANGYKTTALISDSGGSPVVLLSGDGAAARTIEIAGTKVATVLKYKVASGDIADKVKTDVALDAEVKADPKIGTARRGALPLLVGGELIGAFAVSGAPGGEKDEACIKTALDSAGSRLK